MSRLKELFTQTQAGGRLALMPYLTIGYPSRQATLDLIPALAAAGADAFELGIPFSDPLADGPTIQRSTYQALQSGITPAACLEIAGQLRSKVAVPLLLMGYLNPILRYGPERFVGEARAAGVDGLIVADLPVDEAADLAGLCRANGLDLIQFAAPTSTDQRLGKIGKQASGFIYCVSLSGVTGARAMMSKSLPEFLARVRRHSQLPRAVGFGISRPEHVAALHSLAEGAIVGSALIDVIERAKTGQVVEAASRYIRELAAAAGQPAPAG